MEALAAGHKLHVQPRRSANHDQRLFTRRIREPFCVLLFIGGPTAFLLSLWFRVKSSCPQHAPPHWRESLPSSVCSSDRCPRDNE